MASHFDNLYGKTVMITGCRRGIGRTAIELFAAQGCNLICCIRQKDEAFAKFVEQLSAQYHVKMEVLCFDIADEEAIKGTVKMLIKEKRRVDVLVNNAGIATGGILQMTSMKVLKEIFQINFFSMVLLTQLVSKLMIRQHCGSIINMGSIAGLENFAGYTAYGSSKAAVMAFTRTIARELAPYGIRVNAIAPGLTDTRMADQMEKKAEKEIIARSNMNRLGKTEEIVNMILFLSSDNASFITGQVYRVDGGM